MPAGHFLIEELMAPSDTMRKIMPLNPADEKQIDDLFVALKHGDEQEQKQACAVLRKLRRAGAVHRSYIEQHEAVDARIDASLGALRHRYDRSISPFGSLPARTSRPRRYRLGLLSGALAGSFVIGLAAAIWMVNPELSRQAAATAIGQQLTVTLDDDTRVLLNTGSAIRFSNRLRSRDVVLDRGEALFTVAHNAVRPFQVQAQTFTVRDIGTRFSVRMNKGGVDVAVLEGRVGVTQKKLLEPVVLDANEAIHIDGMGVVRREDSGPLTAWKDGRLDFDRAPLAEVAQDVQRYRTAPIVLTDARVGGLLVSGSGRTDHPDRLLQALPAIAPVTVTFKLDGTAVIAPRSEY
ncbi:hypothetical protein WT25_20220 [Burkholderia territorii]|uniref:FecR family protein n=1 Tax=Burkholderia territorii TaxID=1503055 RepID=UPI0007561D80|nr:FecR domain-containing protein [Burkholderia territorii]KVT78862.1 hypothetical protein WT25_20220 [Burkholderia territorii]